MRKTDKEVTEIACGHTTNKYNAWDLKSDIRDLLQCHTFLHKQYTIRSQRGTLCDPKPTNKKKNTLTASQRIFLSREYLYAQYPLVIPTNL